MLDTLLDIGRTLRAADPLRHHRYILRAPVSEPRSPVVYLSLPVSEQYEFDFSKLAVITDEVLQSRLYYLAYKSGEADSLVKYIFGDILYGTDKKGKEVGYYRMKNEKTNAFGQSSFDRGREDAKFFAGTEIEKFRNAFERDQEEIEKLLSERGREQLVLLHFNFQGKQWYQFDAELSAINEKLLDEFLERQNDLYVLRKFIYKTLAPGVSHSPGFDGRNAFKTKAFDSREQVMDLLYALTYSKRPLISERNIKIIVLPKGENLSAVNIEQFFDRTKPEDDERAEALVETANIPVDGDDVLDRLFEPVVGSSPDSIVQFDFVFSKKGGSASTPDVDLVELSGVRRSFLARISNRVKEVRAPLQNERNALYPNRNKQFDFLDIRRSFLNILGDVTTEKKKYQNHLFKVLPQIYSGTYRRDDVLLPTFIEKTEFNIRCGEPNYNLLKYDYYFLTGLQTTGGLNAMDEMRDSKSYKAGLLLGKMAQPLDREIASFEKNYVGLLSRRIADRQGLVKFANFINEKLAIHDVAYPDLKQASVGLAGLLRDLSDQEYRKSYCAFGFFEAYFGRRDGKTETEKGETSNGN